MHKFENRLSNKNILFTVENIPLINILTRCHHVWILLKRALFEDELFVQVKYKSKNKSFINKQYQQLGDLKQRWLAALSKKFFRKLVNSLYIIPIPENLENRHLVYLFIDKIKWESHSSAIFKKVKLRFFEFWYFYFTFWKNPRGLACTLKD